MIGAPSPERAEAIRTLYLQMRHSAWSAVVVSVYIVGTAAPYSRPSVIAAWAALQAVMQGVRLLLIRGFARRSPADAELPRWARIYTMYQALVGALWGSTIYLFAHPDQPITVALTMCCLYSLGAGSVPSNAYNPPGLIALIGCMFTPMVVRLLTTGRFEYILLGAASGLYGIAMLGMCRVQARALTDGFRMRFENRDLLEALTVQKAAADAARQHAEQASLAKSQFLAAASHDLRQPLYALSLFSASLDQLKLDTSGRAVVGNIQDSIGAMEQLFEGLLDLSRLDAGVVQPRPGPVGIDALFDRLSQYFLPLAAARGLELRFRSDGEWVWSDAALLEQVLGNLVGNALRYTRQGGVLLAARRRGAGVGLEVWDTGIGIAAGDLQRIFEEFVQLDNAERDRRRGLGLGLSIARRSAALLGATVSVASRPGRGSRFSLVQPSCAAADAAPVGAAEVAALVSPAGLRVLIVDDDRSVRVALSELVASWGIEVVAAGDATEALGMLEAGRFGLVLSDYRLPGGMNGLALISAVGGGVPCALITADFDPAVIAGAAALDVPVFAKPVPAATLRALMGFELATA